MIRDARRARLVFLLLLLTSLTLLLLDSRGGSGSPFAGVRTAAGTVSGPLDTAVAAAGRPLADGAAWVAAIGRDSTRIAELERANEALAAELRGLAVDNARIRELDDLLGLAGRGEHTLLPARVIAIGPAQGFGWTVAIDAGTRDGVVVDMTVLSGPGLVGRVTTAAATTSTVLLAIDATSSIGVRMETSGQIGWVDGTGEQELTLTLLDGQAPVRAGDRLVSFGSPGAAPHVPYVQGVPVGEVISVDARPGALTRRATVRPFAPFTALDLVAVVVEPPREEPRDAVLPTGPVPAGG